MAPAGAVSVQRRLPVVTGHFTRWTQLAVAVPLKAAHGRKAGLGWAGLAHAADWRAALGEEADPRPAFSERGPDRRSGCTPAFGIRLGVATRRRADTDFQPGCREHLTECRRESFVGD